MPDLCIAKRLRHGPRQRGQPRVLVRVAGCKLGSDGWAIEEFGGGTDHIVGSGAGRDCHDQQDWAQGASGHMISIAGEGAITHGE